MIIEIHQPELENLIHHRMKSGAYVSVEDFLMHALMMSEACNLSEEATGAGLVRAMQACPVKDIELEPTSYPMPVRDVTF